MIEFGDGFGMEAALERRYGRRNRLNPRLAIALHRDAIFCCACGQDRHWQKLVTLGIEALPPSMLRIDHYRSEVTLAAGVPPLRKWANPLPRMTAVFA